MGSRKRMHVIAKSTLRKFWDSSPAYKDAIGPLTEWCPHMEKTAYQTPQEIKKVLRTASVLKGGRVVFNIAGNKYRLVVAIDYAKQLVFVRFVGTHEQYDAINAEEI